jgi:hypothetical protein
LPRAINHEGHEAHEDNVIEKLLPKALHALHVLHGEKLLEDHLTLASALGLPKSSFMSFMNFMVNRPWQAVFNSSIFD